MMKHNGGGIGGLVLGVVASLVTGCVLPCATDVDCWDGQVCINQQCAVASDHATSSTSSGGSGSASSSGSSGPASSSTMAGSGSSTSSSSSGGVAACARPMLLALIRSNDGAGTARGEVRRWSLASGTPTPCSTLTAGGQLDPRDESMAYVPPHFFVTGGQGRLTFYSMETDAQHWRYNQPGGQDGLPLSIFPVTGPAGQAAVATACSLFFNDPDPDFVEVVDPTTQVRLARWELDTAPLQLGISVLTMARHPTRASDIIYTYSTVRDLRTVPLPFNNTPVVVATYAGGVPTGFSRSLHTYAPASGAARVLYSFNPGGGTTLGLQLWTDSGTGALAQPTFTCTLPECAGGHVIDAAADPTDATRAFAICQPGNDQGITHLVRAGPAGGCDTVLVDSALPALSQVYRLAVAD